MTVAPEPTTRLTAKEGLVEHISHAVLAVAVLVWVRRAVRAGRDAAPGTAWVVGAIAAWCGVVLGEELDWGAVYGCTVVAAPLTEWTGRPDVHNAWSGASYLVFAVPVLGLALLGLRRRFGFDRFDATALLVVVVASAVGTLGWPDREAQLDEVAELVLYAVLVWIAVRGRSSPDDAA